MVISGILDIVRLVEVPKNDTIGSDDEVNPEKQKHDFTTKLI